MFFGGYFQGLFTNKWSGAYISCENLRLLDISWIPVLTFIYLRLLRVSTDYISLTLKIQSIPNTFPRIPPYSPYFSWMILHVVAWSWIILMILILHDPTWPCVKFYDHALSCIIEMRGKGSVSLWAPEITICWACLAAKKTNYNVT